MFYDSIGIVKIALKSNKLLESYTEVLNSI
jgi:hypothetical protein